MNDTERSVFVTLIYLHKIIIVATIISIEKNGQLFLTTCFDMLMSSSVLLILNLKKAFHISH